MMYEDKPQVPPHWLHYLLRYGAASKLVDDRLKRFDLAGLADVCGLHGRVGSCSLRHLFMQVSGG